MVGLRSQARWSHPAKTPYSPLATPYSHPVCNRADISPLSRSIGVNDRFTHLSEYNGKWEKCHETDLIEHAGTCRVWFGGG